MVKRASRSQSKRWSIFASPAEAAAWHEAVQLDRQHRKARAKLIIEQRERDRTARLVGAALRRQVREEEHAYRRMVPVAVRRVAWRRTGTARCPRIEMMAGLIIPKSSKVAKDGKSSFHFKWTSRGIGQRRQKGSHVYRRGEAVRHLRYILRDHARSVADAGVISSISPDLAEVAGVFEALEELAIEDRSNSNVFVSVVIALPVELTDEQRERCLSMICIPFNDEQLPFVAVLHAPDERGDQRNHHAHLMLSLRPFDRDRDGGIRFAAGQSSDLNDKAWIWPMRCHIADCLNSAMVRAGHTRRFTPLSNAARGIEPVVGPGKDGPGRKHRERSAADIEAMRTERGLLRTREATLQKLAKQGAAIAARPMIDTTASIVAARNAIAKQLAGRLVDVRLNALERREQLSERRRQLMARLQAQPVVAPANPVKPFPLPPIADPQSGMVPPGRPVADPQPVATVTGRAIADPQPVMIPPARSVAVSRPVAPAPAPPIANPQSVAPATGQPIADPQPIVPASTVPIPPVPREAVKPTPSVAASPPPVTSASPAAPSRPEPKPVAPMPVASSPSSTQALLLEEVKQRAAAARKTEPPPVETPLALPSPATDVERDQRERRIGAQELASAKAVFDRCPILPFEWSKAQDANGGRRLSLRRPKGDSAQDRELAAAIAVAGRGGMRPYLMGRWEEFLAAVRADMAAGRIDARGRTRGQQVDRGPYYADTISRMIDHPEVQEVVRAVRAEQQGQRGRAIDAVSARAMATLQRAPVPAGTRGKLQTDFAWLTDMITRARVELRFDNGLRLRGMDAAVVGEAERMIRHPSIHPWVRDLASALRPLPPARTDWPIDRPAPEPDPVGTAGQAMRPGRGWERD